MKADVVFIGGGLAALVSGIKLLEAGKNVIIISTGQSALHFSSGSFCLINKIGDRPIERPLEHINVLSADHPYRKAGSIEALRSDLEDAKRIIVESGLDLVGSIDKNHYSLTPFGVFTPAWLTLDDHLTVESLTDVPFSSASIIGIDGFLDFFPRFISNGLSKYGVQTVESSVNIKEFNTLRDNPTEMRAPNIARSLDDEGIVRYAEAINRNIKGCDIAIIPAVVGLNDSLQMKRLRELVDCSLYSVPTIPVAVPGIRTKILLQQRFTSLGGWYLLGDKVTDGVIDEGHLVSVNTANLGNTPVKATHFVLASGGLFSRGLKSSIEKVYEPIFGVNVNYESNRELWYDKNFYNPQPFMRFGVETDGKFRCRLGAVTIDNLYAIGSILSFDFDPLSQGMGAGVTLASAMSVANQIIN